MRKIYDHISIGEKIELVEKLKKDLHKLEYEVTQNEDSISPFLRETLRSKRDKWRLEIAELEEEIKVKK
ncbi:hypothetical protein [Pseudalkalibacillus berkeleyi]|uniref:50S ribosomal protein L29 n=1 Tax=Pseudalkalibacillus berkeleyi TaxID=1069813 RepID=A0ABS9GXW7_9BACL|nr:hypothetical protein [Pseudalkalibacillus berkeleyi]MCF6136545.1 hypothetical protein [Pseudalkalibacillus berkeleyi]